MAVFREILTRIGFTVDKGKIKASEVEVARFKKQMSLAAREAKRMRSNLNTALSAAKAMTVAVVGSRAVQALTTAYSGPIDALAKFSAAIGVNVEEMQGWAYGAGLNGVKVEDLRTGLRTLAVSMGAATKAGSEQAKTFGSIGISATDAKGQIKSEAVILNELADKFAASEDGADKAAIAQKLFGDAGVKMIPFLNQGSKGIAAMSAEAKRLGIVMSATQAKEAQAFNDSLTRVKAAVTGVRNQIAAALLPVLSEMGERFQAWASDGTVSAKVLLVLGNAAKLVGLYLARMAAIQVVRMLNGIASASASAWRGLILQLFAIKSNIAAMWALSATGTKAGNVMRLFGLAAFRAGRMVSLGFGKWLLIITAVAAVVGAVYGMLTGQGGAVGKFVGTESMEGLRSSAKELWKVIKPLIPYLAKALVWVINVIIKVLIVAIKGIVAFVKWVAKAIAWIKPYVKAVIDWIVRAWEWAGSAASSAWEGLKSVFDTIYAAGKWIADTLGSAFKWAADVAVKAWNALIAPFVWLYDKMVALYDLVVKVKDKVGFRAFLGMGNMAGGLAEVAAEQDKRRRMAATAPSDNSVKVQSLNVNVTGAPNMTPAELTSRIRDGVANGLQSIIDQAYANRAEAVP